MMAENSTIPKVERICRACCAESGQMSPVFDALQGILPAMFTFCTGLEVEKCDGKPAQICQICLENLQTAYDFKTTCLNSNDEFITMLGPNLKAQKRKLKPQIKSEDGDVKIKKIENTDRKQSIEIIVDKNIDQKRDYDEIVVENIQKNIGVVDKNDQRKNHDVEVDIELGMTNPESRVKVEIVNDDEFSSDDGFDDEQNFSDDDVPLAKVKKEPLKNEDTAKPEVVKRKRDRRYRCSTCLAMFATRSLWRRHLLSEHDVDESHEAGIASGNPIKPGDKVFYSKDAVIIEEPSKSYIKNENENKKLVFGQVEIKKVKQKTVRKRKQKKEEVTIKKIKNGKVVKKSDKLLKTVKVKSENALSDNDSLPDVQNEMLGSANFPLQRQTVTSQLKQYPMRCTVCDLKFTSVKECKQHKREVHGGESDTCVCDLCGKVCRIYTFRAHYGRHFKAPIACSAPGCSFREHAPNLVRTHEARVHGMHNLAKLQCPSCPQQFKYKGGLYDHIKRAHGNMKKDKLCPECGATFYKKDQLARHMQRHQGEKSLSCPVCGALFGYRSNLRVHALKYHDLDLPKLQGGFGNSVIVADKTLKDQFSTDKTKEKCPHCEFTSVRARGIRSHIQTAHPELADAAPRAPKYRTPLKEGEQRTVFKCPQCPAQLSRNCHLKRHLVNVHGIKEPLAVQPTKVTLPALDAAAIINAAKEEPSMPPAPPLVEGAVKRMEE